MRKQIIKPNISKTPIRINWNKTKEKQTECYTHIHDEYELTTCVYGSILYTINDKKYIVKEGDVLFVNSNVPHSTIAMENTYYIPIILRGETDNKKLFYHDTFRFMEQDAVLMKKDTLAAHELYNCIVTAKNDFSEKKPFYEEYVKADTKKLLAIMHRYSLIINADDDAIREKTKRIFPAIEYIHHNFQNHISLDEISKIINVDRSHFCRLFKSNLEISFVDYLNALRIMYAEKLLMAEEYSIEQISRMCGFSTPEYFGKVFKKLKYCSPTDYRKYKSPNNLAKTVIDIKSN